MGYDKEKKKLYHLKNREKIIAYSRKRHHVNRIEANAKRRQWSLDNPRQKRNTDYLLRYGISLEDYEKKLHQQNNMCAVCQKTETGKYKGKLKRLAVDHCHRTGKVRDLLCTKCNSVLGYVDDNPTLLERMINYLKRHKDE